MWNIININECDRRGEIVLHLELPLAKTIEEVKDVWKVKKNCRFTVMWVDASKSMIQDEGDELTKQELNECAKIAMSEVKTVSFESENHTHALIES